jgi:hypothetical protein
LRAAAQPARNKNFERGGMPIGFGECAGSGKKAKANVEFFNTFALFEGCV